MSGQDLPLRHSLRQLRRHGWLIVLVPLLAVVCAGLFVSREKPVYAASSEIFVAQAGGTTQALLGDLPLTQTMMNILESNVIARKATQSLSFKLSPADLNKNLTVQEDPSSSILTVTYDSPNKSHALEVLRAVQRAFNSLIHQRLGVSGSLHKTGPLQIVASVLDPPHIVPGQVSPKPAKTLAFAAAIGLAIGLLLAFVRNALDDRIRGRRDAEESFGAPVIGVLPGGLLASRNSERHVGRASPAIEALDRLGANLQLHQVEMGRSLLVTSALEDDTSSALVAKLGVALAQAGHDVACVELDRERSVLRSRFEMADDGDSDHGIAGVLAGKLPLSDAFVRVPLHRSSNGDGPHGEVREGQLMFLPFGALSIASALLSPERLAELVKQLSGQAEYVLFDCPGLLSVTHGLPLASVVDGVLVVAREDRTRRERAHAVQAVLKGLGVEKVAVVLIRSRPLQRIRSAA